MSLVGNFLRFHRRPGAVFRHRLATATEARAFAVLVLALIITFLGRIPGLVVQQEALALAPALAATFMGGVLFGSLLLYAIAAPLRWLMGGPNPGLQARIIVFWSLLVLAPWGVFANLLMARLTNPLLEVACWALLAIAFVSLIVTGRHVAGFQPVTPMPAASPLNRYPAAPMVES